MAGRFPMGPELSVLISRRWWPKLPVMERSALRRGLNIGDALKLGDLWQGAPPPSSIITSPPYLDMHDYGNASQIGTRGQPFDDYLAQVARLFGDCYRITADDATFWLVAGSVRRNGRVLRIPDRLATCAEEAGWGLREAITWDKQKALPWTHHGEFRDITEQILLFSKTDNFRFDPTGLRSPIPNSIWWRRYPERYSPDGSMPTNLWSIPIPTQGSWSGVRTHFCPFPEELTYRMLALTTVEGDIVLDPLAGVGSVPAMANAMGRIGYGLDLTAEYVRLYDRTVQSATRFLSRMGDDRHRREEFKQTIIELRLLKFAKLLGKVISEEGIPISWVRVTKSNRLPAGDFKIVAGDFELVLGDDSLGDRAASVARSAIAKPPLSKFGIDARLLPVRLSDAVTTGYWYASGRFWNAPTSRRQLTGVPHVVSELRPIPDMIDDTPYA